MRGRRRPRGPSLARGLTLGLLVWAAGTATVVGLNLDAALVPLLGPARIAGLVGFAHLVLAVVSLLRIGVPGLAVAVARLVFHAVLTASTTVALVVAFGVPLEAALGRATWNGPLLLLVQLVSAGLALAPLETVPVPRQRPARGARAGSPAAYRTRTPGPRGAVATRPLAVPTDPGAAQPKPRPGAPPVPAPIETPPEVLTSPVNGSPEHEFDPDQGPRREASATTAAEAPAASRAEVAPPVEAAESVIRIPFERVADQLPGEAFSMPLDRVAASLLEPGRLLVPQRILLPQVAEGQAQVDWNVVAEQVPVQVLAWAHAEIRRHLPGGVLTLPLDEVVRQLPPDVFALSGPTPDLRQLEDFPLPFQPHVPPPSESPTEATRTPDPAEAAPSDVAVRVEAEAPPEAEPVGVPADDGVPPPEVAQETEAPADRAGHGEPSLWPGALESLPGAWQLRTHHLDGLRVVTLTGPDVAPAEAARLTADLADLLDDPRLPSPVQQLTVRGSGGTLVLTPIEAISAGGPILAATAEPHAALAQLERAALRLARGSVNGASRAAPVEAGDLVDVPVPPALRDVAKRLRAFGTLTAAVLQDGSGLALYLLLAPGTAARPIAGWARDLRAAVEGGLLGSLESAAVRLGEDRLLLRAVAAGRGAAALLVAGGAPVDRLGLARLELERAATRLGAP